jgi:hypothetical protein
MTNDEDDYLSFPNLICIRIVLFGASNTSQNVASDTSPNLHAQQSASYPAQQLSYNESPY